MKKLIVLTLALFFIFQTGLFAAEKKTILVIGSYHAEYPWEISYREGIKETLGHKYTIEPFYMDTKRLPPSEHAKAADMAWKKYQEIKPSLVILGDDNALKYLTERFSKTKTPVVYLGINANPRDYGAFDKDNITGVLERPLVERSISILKRIVKPELKKVLVLYDSGPTSEVSVAEAFGGKTTLVINGVETDLKLIGKWEEWQNTVLKAKGDGYNTIVVGLFHTIRDAQDKHVGADQVLAWTVQYSPLPPFGFWDFIVGPDKAIGGFVLFGKAQGEEAAKLALKILRGKSPGDISPVIGKRGEYLFSRSQLKKWNLKLPADILSMTKFTN